jgi:LacI family transcriptional regulator
VEFRLRPAGILDAMRREIGEAAARAAVERTSLRLVEAPPGDTAQLAATLDRLAGEGVDGVAVMAPETPQVRDALRRLHDRGVRLVTLGSDLPGSPRDHFVGIDNIAAGRSAAVLMGRFLGDSPGRIIVLAGSMLARVHAERRLGFDRVMQAEFPRLEVLPSIEGRDDADLIAALLPAALAAHPGVRGIYASGAGHRGLVAVLHRMGLAGRIVVIAHDLTPRTRLALMDGTYDAVISQDVGHMIRSAIRVLRAKVEGQDILAAQERIRIEIFIKENLP